MSPTQLSQFWRTTRHLQLSQIAWRARRVADRLVEQRLPRWRSGSLAAETLTVGSARPLPPLRSPTGFDPLRLVAELQAGGLTLLNEPRRLGTEQIDWRTEPGPTDRLWNITLHYHQWLYALVAHADASGDASAAAARQLAHRYLRDWLATCDRIAARAGSLVWNAYAVATRLHWWARMIDLLEKSSETNDKQLAVDLRASAARQADYLHGHLEWDLRANHLLRDGVGLAVASCLFSGVQAEQWRRTARRIALEQAGEQVLADGGHFERSPMYHLETLADFRLLHDCFLDDRLVRETIHETIARMIQFAAWLQHPDGRTPQLNDSTRRLVAATEGLPERPTGFRHFRETGLVCWHSADWSIFFDCGPVGPDYQPGHTHADTLTLEASVGGERMLIDPGVGRYDAGPERSADRATASHNTVAIDDTDSSEVWHLFRVGRRAYPVEVQAEASERGFMASAAHDGYDHLPGRPRHGRRVELRGGELIVIDTVTGEQNHKVQGQWLLDPGWQIEAADHGWMLHSAQQTVVVSIGSNQSLEVSIEAAECHFEFGHTAATRRLRWRYEGSLPLEVRTIFRTNSM